MSLISKTPTSEDTNRSVNLRERFLSEALQRLVSAKADVMKARISLLWATGLI